MFEPHFNQVAGLKAYNFFRKRLQQRCFPVNIEKIFKNNFFIEHLRWKLLNIRVSAEDAVGYSSTK